MGARREPPGAVTSLRLELDLDDVRVEPSAVDVKLHVTAGPALVMLSMTGDEAIDLANQLTDAVDQLDGRCHR